MTSLRTEVVIRAAERSDVPRIIELAGQLGYTVSAARVGSAIDVADDRALLVAIDGESVVGWIALARDMALLGEGDGWIEGLVVAEAHRNHSVGSTLLACAHEWARKKGCVRMRVRSNVVRDRAHRFYEREGYRRFKTQHNYEYRL
ncbi:MAG: GNAT family N-acetyltransferase [Candidatus Eremiobacteraeota bacterium]|nr:GNAT family N-acetyltransferase [Candidatus Eremiobacteraeota bacterium]